MAKLKAKETAVILVEFQNEFCKPGGKFYDAMKGEIERQHTVANGIKLMNEARKKGCLIVHSPFVFDANWVDKHCVCGIIAGSKEGGALRPGDWGTELIEEMKPQAKDFVLQGKRALSAFTNTNLEETLRKHGIKNVACCGFVANVCCEATARGAYDLGFAVTFVKDAMAGMSKANQDYVEREVAPVIGNALSTDEFLANLE